MTPLAPLRRRIVIGGSAAAILVIGVLLKPAAPAVTPPSSETPAPMLQEVVQQREAQSIFRRMQDTWPRVARFTARVALMPSAQDLIEFGPVDPRRAVERFGVVAGTRRILADTADFPEGALVRVTLGDGRAFEARTAGAGADRPLAAIEAPAGVVLDPPFRTTTITAGTALFAAAPRADGSVIAPLFVAHASARELLTTNALDAFRGMAVFDLDGQLAGVLAHERGEVRLLTAAAALEPRPPALPEPRAPLGLP
jgi:hypothetical protein